MTIRSSELPKQVIEVTGKKPKVKRSYTVWGSLDKTDILLYLAATSPQFDQAIDLATGQIVPVFRNHVSADEKGGGVWECTVDYEGSPNTVELSVTLGVQSSKTYEALERIESYETSSGGLTGGGVPGNDSKTIGVNGDEVEGVEVEGASVSLCITKKWQRAQIPANHFQILLEMVSPYTAVNQGTWVFNWMGQTLTFPQGSARFRGSSIKSNSDEELQMDYHIAYQKGIVAADNYTINSGPVMIREGWHYLWIQYVSTVANGRITKTPTYAHVDRVYPYANFSALDL